MLIFISIKIVEVSNFFDKCPLEADFRLAPAGSGV